MSAAKKKKRRCIDTCTSKQVLLPTSYRCKEFLGNYSGTLGGAPTGILAFVLGPRRADLWTVEVGWP